MGNQILCAEDKTQRQVPEQITRAGLRMEKPFGRASGLMAIASSGASSF